MLQGAFTKMDGVSAAKGFYIFNSKNNFIIDTFITAYGFVVGVGAIPLRLFFRKKLGERSFSPFAFLVSIGLLFIAGGLSGLVLAVEFSKPKSALEVTNTIFIIYFFLSPVAFFILYSFRMAVKHYREIINNYGNKVVGYSYSRGESKYFGNMKGKEFLGFTLNKDLIRILVEPCYGFILGIIILFVAIIGITFFKDYSFYKYIAYPLGYIGGFGALLIFCSFCLFLEEIGIQLRKRAAILDIFDGEVDMVYIQKEKSKLFFKPMEGLEPTQVNIQNNFIAEIVSVEELKSLIAQKTNPLTQYYLEKE